MNMEEPKELRDLKSVLRSLVVSSPTQMDVRSLLRDYREMIGVPLPAHEFGYKDPLTFLKEQCSDCFLFQGLPSNPQLTLIVTNSIKHIDEFVRRQKASSSPKFRGKRRSVPESIMHPSPNRASTFRLKQSEATPNTVSEVKDTKPPEYKAPARSSENQNNNKDIVNSNPLKSKADDHGILNKRVQEEMDAPNVGAFLRKKFNGTASLTPPLDDDPFRDMDSGRLTADSSSHSFSSGSSGKRAALEELKEEVRALVAAEPAGVWANDIFKLYRQRYGRELELTRYGLTRIGALVGSLGVSSVRAPDGRVLLGAPAPASPPRRRRSPDPAPPTAHADAGPNDALPWINYDPDVFPEDCMVFCESIPPAPLTEEAGDMVGVIVGEVYSPSHFWLIRLGEQHNLAMEAVMDEMTEYYTRGEGAARRLAAGAVRVGHYVSSVYEGDWHRSLIVNVLDSDTVKVRHVDYGTVERAATRGLRPLRRAWGALPAQAVRARLAGVRPAARGAVWPHAAAAHFLGLVRDKRFVANVVAVDHEERILEVCLVDTSSERDVRLDHELVRAGHADPQPTSALHAAETYLQPAFAALESGATPSYGDIAAYLRDGIALEFVDAYRRHVLAPPAPPARVLCSRVPLPFCERAASRPAPCHRVSPSTSPSPPASAAPSSPDSLFPPATPELRDTSSSPSLSSPPAYVSPARAPPAPSPPASPAPRAPSPSPPPPDSLFPPATPELRDTSSSPSLSSPPAYVSPARAPPAPSPPASPAPRAPSPSPPPPPPPPPAPRTRSAEPARPRRVSTGVQTAPAAPQLSMAMDPFASPTFVPAISVPPLPMFNMYPGPPMFHPLPTYQGPPFVYGPPFRPPACPPRAEPRSPPPPYCGEEGRRSSTAAGVVTLSVSECEMFYQLSRVDAHAAQWYMIEAIGRAMGARGVGGGGARDPRLNPHAREFRATPRPPPPDFRPA